MIAAFPAEGSESSERVSFLILRRLMMTDLPSAQGIHGTGGYGIWDSSFIFLQPL